MKKRSIQFLGSSRGSVLMEYLVLLVFVGAVMVVASNTLFFGYTENGFEIGLLGQKIQGFYQRTAGGLSLPVP